MRIFSTVAQLLLLLFHILFSFHYRHGIIRILTFIPLDKYTIWVPRYIYLPVFCLVCNCGRESLGPRILYYNDTPGAVQVFCNRIRLYSTQRSYGTRKIPTQARLRIIFFVQNNDAYAFHSDRDAFPRSQQQCI